VARAPGGMAPRAPRRQLAWRVVRTSPPPLAPTWGARPSLRPTTILGGQGGGPGKVGLSLSRIFSGRFGIIRLVSLGGEGGRKPRHKTKTFEEPRQLRIVRYG
jgi:hypothetical protein